jgi:hypothetical protein
MTFSPTPTELLALRTANAALLESSDAHCDLVATIVFGLGSAQLLQSPETAAELGRLRDRVTELETAAAKAAGFCAQRAEYVTNLRSCAPNNDRDYYRWSGHAEARRQLSRLLALPVGWPAEDIPAEPALPVEDPHDSPLRHAYKTGRDFPEVPRA